MRFRVYPTPSKADHAVTIATITAAVIPLDVETAIDILVVVIPAHVRPGLHSDVLVFSNAIDGKRLEGGSQGVGDFYACGQFDRAVPGLAGLRDVGGEGTGAWTSRV